MTPIEIEKVQREVDRLANKTVFLHLETTNGAYSAKKVGAYIRNGSIHYSEGRIKGTGPFRVGLKMEHGWVYAEGLTHWEVDEKGRLLLAGHDEEGKLAVACQIGEEAFE
ncbi:MAG TPA: YojF family protein [Bacillales bacterium]|nr:YojF family protein [Bacillales bacterium]